MAMIQRRKKGAQAPERSLSIAKNESVPTIKIIAFLGEPRTRIECQWLLRQTWRVALNLGCPTKQENGKGRYLSNSAKMQKAD